MAGVDSSIGNGWHDGNYRVCATNELGQKVKLIAYSRDSEELIKECGITSRGKTIINKSASEFVDNLVKWDHESPLEHAVATIRFEGVSRVFTHQLVRHRLSSITQESQRFSSVDVIVDGYVIPKSIQDDPNLLESFVKYVNEGMILYKSFIKKVGKDDARYILPECLSCSIVITANLREWMTILRARLAPEAHWEIRGLMNIVACLLYSYVSRSVFKDFITSDMLDNYLKLEKEEEFVK